MRRVLVALVAALPLAVVAPAAAGTNVYLIIDSSGSMAGRMEGRSKLDVAKDVLLGLVNDLPADAQITVSAYGHRRKDDCEDIETLAPLGPKGASLEGRVRALKPVGMTPISNALEAAGREALARKGDRNVIVLVSDGLETCKKDPCAVAKRLRESGVQVEVSVIGFDVKAEERKQLECIARDGGGKYYDAAGAREFQLAAADVKQQIAQAPVPAAAPAAGAFRDDFEGTKLNPAWKLLKEDKNRWVLEGGKLTIVTQKGGIWQKTDTLRNQFVLERDLPPNYVVTTKVAMTLRAQNQWTGVLVYLDKDNYLQAGYWAKPWGNNLWRKAVFAKELDGQTNVLEFEPRAIGGEPGVPKLDFMGPVKDPENVWLRVEKKGNTFAAAFSMDGRHWHKIGDHTMLRTGAARVSLMASNESAGDAAEVAAEFDFVEIQPQP